MWHVGRYRFLKKFCNSKGLPLPRIVIGEFGADYVGDIGTWLKTLPSDGGQYDSVDGWRDLITQWRRWWPKLDGASAYMMQMQYSEDHVYTDEEIELIALYARWNDGSWGTYQTNPELDQQMEDRGQAELNNPPAPPPPVNEPPVIVNPPVEEIPEPMPETPTEPPVEQLPVPSAPTWMKNFTANEKAMIELGRLMMKSGEALGIKVISNEEFELIGKLAGMLDSATRNKSM